VSKRTNPADRVFRDRSTSTTDDDTRDDFPAVGAYDIASTVDGPPDPYVREVDSPGKYVSPRVLRHRTPVQINATSGAKLDQRSANLLTRAATTGARHLTSAETVEQSDPHVRAAYLDHVFGLNLPDRA
jgi:hypothetical protein